MPQGRAQEPKENEQMPQGRAQEPGRDGQMPQGSVQEPGRNGRVPQKREPASGLPEKSRRPKEKDGNRRALGAEKERLAEEYLTERGYRMVERNFRCREGEIDLVAMEGGCLVFVEVRFRSGRGRGSAAESVTAAKQRRICRVSDVYRCVRRVPGEMPVRYDVAAIDGEELHLYRDAFPYQGRCW